MEPRRPKCIAKITSHENRQALLEMGDLTEPAELSPKLKAATTANLVFKHFAGAAEDPGSACFAYADVNAGDLCVVQPMQNKQMSAVIHD